MKSSTLKHTEKGKKIEEKTPVEKLIDSIRAYLKLDFSKIRLTSIAGIIALIGLFMNNVAIIIGAMLLSPLLGPISVFAINTVVGDGGDAFKSISNLLIMLFVVMALSSLFTQAITLFFNLTVTNEILSRMDAITSFTSSWLCYFWFRFNPSVFKRHLRKHCWSSDSCSDTTTNCCHRDISLDVSNTNPTSSCFNSRQPPRVNGW